MCSIVGIISKEQNKSKNRHKLEKMLSSLIHRGPDEVNIYLSQKVFLGNNRLSINHPSAKNTQPSLYKHIVVVFNGEIYNYKELKEELKRDHNVNFDTHCDTEVIPKLYYYYGKNFIKKVNGQFAIALYDKNKNKLFLYRDRLGKKPLYYKKDAKNIYFSSETIGIKSVSMSDIDFNEVNNIVGYWSPINSIYNSIVSVKEGTFLEIDIDNLQNTEHTYWQLDKILNQKKDQTIDKQSSQELVHEGIKSSIKTRLNTDVGFGVYLSGGLDSSIITHELSNIDMKFKTYSIGFKDSIEHNEMKFQKKISDHYGIENIRLDISNDDIYNSFEEYVLKTENILFRTAPIPMYLLSKVAHNAGEKVIFSGEGADELFFGYDIFREIKYSKLLKKRSKNIQEKFIKKIYPYMLNEKHLKYLQIMLLSRNNNNLFSSHFLREKVIGNFSKYYKESNSYLSIKEYLEEYLHDISSDLVRAQFIEYKTLLLNYLLSVQGDLPTMHNSIEARAPFLDYKLIETVATIPINNIFPTFKEKEILKNIYKNKLPSVVVNRVKQPYRAPDSIIFYKKFELIEKINAFKDFGNFSKEKVLELTKNIVNNLNISYQESLYFIVIYSTLLILNKQYSKSTSRLIINNVIDDS